MKTKNAMQLKARIKDKAKESGTTAQLMMQNYLLERVLERISLSPWRDRIVIKGGVLISSLIGVDKRSTKDLDTTIQGFPLTHDNAARAFREIIAVDADDDFTFEFIRTENIRELDEYPGIRVFLVANYERISSPITIDVTTGDRITPDAILYSYPLLFDDRSITLMTYPLATVLAEKLEAVISRDVGGTRPRDYYDVYMLWLTRGHEVNPHLLKEALAATTQKRKTTYQIDNYHEVLERVATDANMLKQWDSYAKNYPYVAGLTLQETCNVIVGIMDAMEWSDESFEQAHASPSQSSARVSKIGVAESEMLVAADWDIHEGDSEIESLFGVN